MRTTRRVTTSTATTGATMFALGFFVAWFFLGDTNKVADVWGHRFAKELPRHGCLMIGCAPALARRDNPESRPMSEHEHVIAKKLANMLVPSAEHRVPSGSTKRVIDAFQAYYGGLWIGGTVYLTEGSLVFRPNFINRLAHKGDMRRTVGLRDVVGVEDRRGWFTNIVDVHLRDASKFTFRCYGATRFSQAIRDQATRVGTRQN